MKTESIPTIVIGAGQAGLATGYHLARRGRPFVILDAHQRVGDNWRRYWDSLRLYSPAKYDSLPGLRFPAPSSAYPGKDAMADYLERYAAEFGLPVRGGTRVVRVAAMDGRYLVSSDGQDYLADNVVVSTGTFGGPYVPSLATELDPRIRQLHSSEYHDPSQLRGTVLVVGASHSGGDIAYESGRSGHPTILCGRDTGQIPVRVDSAAGRWVFPLLWFVWDHVLTIDTPFGRKERPEVRMHGGPLLRYRRKDLKLAGVERVTERVTGVRDGRPVLAGGRMVDADTVVWCTGFRQDFSWIELPVFADDGWPHEERGVVAEAPGLYFTGLAFQRAFTSMLIGGAGRDADHVAAQIDARMAGTPNTGRRQSLVS